MVDYEVMTSKRDFDDLLEGIDRKRSSGHLDLSQKSRQPSLSKPDFSFEGSRRTLGIVSSIILLHFHSRISSNIFFPSNNSVLACCDLG